MRKKVYVFDEYITSKRNGIGSFLKEFNYCMEQIDTDICIITFNANIEEFNIQRGEDGKMSEMLFPPFAVGDFIDNAEIIIKLFRLYILDALNNVFFINHSPCEILIEILKKNYTQSNFIYVIHNFRWASLYLGDVKQYMQDISQKKNVVEQGTNVIDAYKKDIKTCALVDRIVCLSKSTYDLLQSTYLINCNKMVLIPNGLKSGKNYLRKYDKKKIRKELFISNDEKILLFVGRPTLQKGIYALLDAFQIILKKHSKVRLVIIGFDNNNGLEYLMKHLSSCVSCVSFIGFIDKKELKKWYLVADIGIIPSYYEQCSYVGIEMMMYGLPIVVSDGFGIQDMFQDNINALIAPIGKRKSTEEFSYNIAQLIEKLMLSEELRKALGKNARKKYCKYYNVNQMQKGYRDLLSSL